MASIEKESSVFASHMILMVDFCREKKGNYIVNIGYCAGYSLWGIPIY
jgi:hypothetical protein